MVWKLSFYDSSILSSIGIASSGNKRAGELVALFAVCFCICILGVTILGACFCICILGVTILGALYISTGIFGGGTSRSYFRNHELINWIIVCYHLGMHFLNRIRINRLINILCSILVYV